MMINQLIYVYIKKYWSIAIMIISAIIMFFLFRRRNTNISNNLKRINSIHNEEIKKINSIRIQEKKALEENAKEYKKSLAKIKKEYKKSFAELNLNTKKKAKQIAEKYNDPNKLANELSKKMGFKLK